MQLYSFFNSSTSYRVRIALALKGLPYDYLGVNIRTGQHRDHDAQNGKRPGRPGSTRGVAQRFHGGRSRFADLGADVVLLDFPEFRLKLRTGDAGQSAGDGDSHLRV